MRRPALALVALGLLAACTSGSGGATATAEESFPSVPPASIGGAGGANGELDEAMIDNALERAAQDTGVAVDEITVVTAEEVTWSDGSIGCPEEGMAYTQALVPGFRVVLEVDGEELHYHAASDGQFFQCANPIQPVDDGRVDR